MSFRSKSDAALAAMGVNIATKLAAHEVDCLDNALADDLAAAMAPVNASFEASIEECVVMATNKLTVFQAKRDQRALELERINTVYKYLASVNAEKKYYDMLGLPYRKPASRVNPAAPSNLAATGTSNGVNDIVWIGNNPTGNVVYQLWRRQGDEGDWGFLNITKKQRLIDTPVTPGQYYEYKVRAVADNGSFSAWSNSAIVYGAP